MNTSKNKKIVVKDFDEAFEKGGVTEHLDLKSVKVRYPTQQLSIDFSKNLIDEVDKNTAKRGELVILSQKLGC